MGDFNWWLLIIGVVAGGLLTWLVLAESTRREREIGERELPAEAAWIARTLATPTVDAAAAEDVLRAHRRYLGFPPPDVLVEPEELTSLGEQGVVADPPAELVAAAPVADEPVTGEAAQGGSVSEPALDEPAAAAPVLEPADDVDAPRA